MTRAYDEALLNIAEVALGRMLDYAVHSLHIKQETVLDLFIASGTAALFEKGDARTICGMSGAELAFYMLEKSGAPYERAVQRHTIRLSSEYWCGYSLAALQWEFNMPFSELLEIMPADYISSSYEARHKELLSSLPWDIDDAGRKNALDDLGSKFTDDISKEFKRRLGASRSESPLKIMRIKNGLSQSQLAKASSVPVRTIQQYEQRQKDINKARSSYLIALSSALNCDPKALLERD